MKPAMDALTALNRYIDREPLNEELRAARDGELGVEVPAHPAEKAAGVTPEATAETTRLVERGDLLEWVPNRRQLVALSEAMAGEGWGVYLLLQKKRLEILRETAITVSQNDPLRNKDDIAMEWAYHGLYQKALGEMEAVVAQQLERLRVKE